MSGFLALVPLALLFITYGLAYFHDNILPLKNYSTKARNIFVFLMIFFGVLSLISSILIYAVFDLI